MSYRSYADIVIDISHENLDKTYQYAIPEDLISVALIGTLVVVPFGRGNRQINGYIVAITGEPKLDADRIKPIISIVENAPIIESHLIYLAYWMKETFGGTMNDALKTVIPVKKAVQRKEQKSICLKLESQEAKQWRAEFLRKNNTARVRLLDALLLHSTLDYDEVIHKLKVSRATILGMEKLGIVDTLVKQIYRNPIETRATDLSAITLNSQQQIIVNEFRKDYEQGLRGTHLIHGITGSGKTEVYMEIIASVIEKKKQVILLIPEIALTYGMVQRFYQRFGERISIMNSKMSHGERYDQSLRARNGEIDIMIGPRSALFTPFQNLGLIIIDEEHEASYKSEASPRYHAVLVALERARLTGAAVILGSATPSLESYYKTQTGEYKLHVLTKRAKKAQIPKVWIEDLREELKRKNTSIFSEKLKELIQDRLAKKEQIILFLNRRGFAGFVSCRSCGYVVKCPHCDISLTTHNNGNMVCHYCGYETKQPSTCPTCGSRYIATFGTGTQKVEELVKRDFPNARVLRMDADTTKQKGAHEKILTVFSEQKADILVGTQMIVKGHDFPKVTLVGILAADLSLYTGDYRASERTFQLLCQAAGRAGRDALAGEVVIQTYHPEHYSIITAAAGDYLSFYKQEMNYRSLMGYPPTAHILLMMITSKKEERVQAASIHLGKAMKEYEKQQDVTFHMIGPAPAQVTKAFDLYRRVIYIKSESYNVLIQIKNYVEGYFSYSEQFADCNLQFDFDPMSGY